MTGAGQQQKASTAMDDRFRTSDADRDRAAALLRDHFTAGRLTPEELDVRLTATLNAHTLGDLRRVLADLPGPVPVPQHARRVPPEAGRLERGYRRLLFFYPARYRRVHDEEILAVLMTAAPDGQRRPGIAEAADLIWGALRVRLQPQRDGGEPAWRDALAVLSVILPVIMLVIFTVQETRIPPSAPLWVLEQIATPFALVALVLLRLRRLAILAAVAILLGVAFLSGNSMGVNATMDAWLFVPLVLETAALAASPGPRRALQILTWKHCMLGVTATLAVATGYVVFFSYPVTLILIAVIGMAMVLASSLGRWLLMLLAVAAWPFFLPPLVVTPWLFYLPHGVGVVGWAYLLPAALLSMFAVAARRESRRWSRFPPASH
jgi:hypothetical protein